MQTVGEKLRTLRKARRFTQQELAQGIASASLVSQIESGRIQATEAMLAQFAQKLNIETTYFADDYTNKEPANSYRKAKSLMAAERYPEAADMLMELKDSPPLQIRPVVVYNELALCLTRGGRLKEAIEIYETLADMALVTGDPSMAVQSLFQVGHVARQLHDITVAQMYWERAALVIDRNPDLKMPVAMRVHANLGRLFFQSGDITNARTHYEAAIDLAEQFSASLDLAVVTHGLANVALASGGFVEASHLTMRAMKMYASCGHERGVNQCRVNQVLILRTEGNYAEALRTMEAHKDESGLRRDSLRYANLLLEGAACHEALGNMDEALSLTEQAVLSVKPESERWPQLQCAVIKLLCKMQRFPEALKRIKSVFKTSPRIAPEVKDKLQFYEIDCLLRQTSVERAAVHLLDLLARQPEYSTRSGWMEPSFPAE